MWVADMDFRAAPPIIDALRRRVEHGVFGYVKVPEAYYDAVVNWFSRRHGWRLEREWILYTSGVVPAVSVVVKALCEPGDKVILQTPVYNCFFSSVRNNGCEVLENPLRNDGGRFTIDYDDLERKAADPRARLLVLCNPHNPVGRVWTAGELERLNDICLRHGVRVLSDEIHCELTRPGLAYQPFAAVSEGCLHNAIVANSPSKSFNTAGLQIANIISDDAATRARIDRAINVNEVCDVNPFGVEGLIAAYNEGEAWLDALRGYLWGNYEALCAFFAERLPALRVTPLEAHIPRVGGLPPARPRLRRACAPPGRRGPRVGEQRHHVRAGGRGLHPHQHSLPAQPHDGGPRAHGRRAGLRAWLRGCLCKDGPQCGRIAVTRWRPMGCKKGRSALRNGPFCTAKPLVLHIGKQTQ